MRRIAHALSKHKLSAFVLGACPMESGHFAASLGQRVVFLLECDTHALIRSRQFGDNALQALDLAA